LATLQEQLKKARLDLNRARNIQKVKESYTKDTRYGKFDPTSDTGKTAIAELQAASKKVIEAQTYYDNLQAALAKQTAKEELTGAKKGVSEEVQAAKQGLTVEELRAQNQKVLDDAAAKKAAEQSTVTDQNQLNSYSQFRDTLADPANDALLKSVQADLKKNFPDIYSGGINGIKDWEKTQAAIETIYTKRGGLPVVLRGTDLRTFIANPTIPGFGSSTSSTPSTSLQISDPTRAAGLIKSAFDSIKVGRDPTPEEIAQLTKDLNLAERKNPFKTINGVTTGGLDKNEFLIQAIQKLPAYAETLKVKSDKNKQALASTALANGYDLERDFSSQLPNWLDAINKGESISKFQSSIRNSARLALPEAVRNSIDPTEDLTTAFATYISNYSKTFGVPADQVSLNKILPLATNDKGFIPIYEFEKKKRQLAEWDKTPEARTETANVVSTVLKDFGFKG